MGFRFRRRVRLARGIWLNVGKSGSSLSVGGRGATANFGKDGTTTTVGIPGTGLSYRTTARAPEAEKQPQARAPSPWWLQPALLAALLGLAAFVGQSHFFR